MDNAYPGYYILKLRGQLFNGTELIADDSKWKTVSQSLNFSVSISLTTFEDLIL